MKHSTLTAVESLLECITAPHSKLGRENQIHPDRADDGSDPDNITSRELSGTETFDYLLSKERGLETNLTETGYLVEPAFRYGRAFTLDGHGNVAGHAGALIDENDGSTTALNPDTPLIDRLIAGDIERPLSERMRVTAYLVRIFSQLVGKPGFTVGRLCQLVGTLRELIRLARLEQGNQTGDSPDTADGSSDRADDRPDITHDPDSTEALK